MPTFLLAMQNLRDVTGVPDTNSIKSIFCVFGIIYLIACIAAYSGGLLKGIGQNCLFFTFGLIIYLSMGDCSMVHPRIYGANKPLRMTEKTFTIDDLKSIEYHSTVGNQFQSLDEAVWDNRDGYVYDLGYKVFCLNDPLITRPDSDAKWKIYIPWKVFHPACLMWCPLLCGALPLILLGMLLFSGKK